VFLNRNLDQNMPEKALFVWKKAVKIVVALEDPPNPRWPPVAGDPHQTPCLFLLFFCYNFSLSVRF